MILVFFVGIIVNLVDASIEVELNEYNDVVEVLVSMDCSDIVFCGF